MVKYEQAKNEILKHNAIPLLIECSGKFNELSKQFFLECLWTLSFNKQAAEQMRKNVQFIHLLEYIKESSVSEKENHSLSKLINDEIYKVVDGLLWNLVKGLMKR